MYVNVQTYANGSIVNIDLATLLTSWIVYHQIHQTERVGQIAIFINNPKKRHFESLYYFFYLDIKMIMNGFYFYLC